jgi:hypothetical protein
MEEEGADDKRSILRTALLRLLAGNVVVLAPIPRVLGDSHDCHLLFELQNLRVSEQGLVRGLINAS